MIIFPVKIREITKFVYIFFDIRNFFTFCKKFVKLQCLFTKSLMFALFTQFFSTFCKNFVFSIFSLSLIFCLFKIFSQFFFTLFLGTKCGTWSLFRTSSHHRSTQQKRSQRNRRKSRLLPSQILDQQTHFHLKRRRMDEINGSGKSQTTWNHLC